MNTIINLQSSIQIMHTSPFSILKHQRAVSYLNIILKCAGILNWSFILIATTIELILNYNP
jgi:hypothetical protein